MSVALNESKLVSVVMGSQSDFPTMRLATEVLEEFSVPYETRILSAHRTPKRLRAFAQSAEQRGVKIIIAGAGGAAHLPGMLAAETTVPVFGVPIKSRALNGLDALLSIVQMPRGIPVATLSIGGAFNAALMAIAVLAVFGDEKETLKQKLHAFRAQQTREVAEQPENLPVNDFLLKEEEEEEDKEIKIARRKRSPATGPQKQTERARALA